MKLVNESPLSSMIFASSDFSNPTLWPELIVQYTVVAVMEITTPGNSVEKKLKPGSWQYDCVGLMEELKYSHRRRHAFQPSSWTLIIIHLVSSLVS